MVVRERELTPRSQTKDKSTPVKKTPLEEEEEEAEDEKDERELMKVRESHRRATADLIMERKEKDALLLRNAELSQTLISVKSQLAAANQAAEAAAAAGAKESSPAAAETANASSAMSLDTSETSRSSAQTQQQQQQQPPSTEGILISDEICDSSPDEMKKFISELQSQLTEKNKTVKLQQQRIGDLRKTIQREFKMQSAGGGGGGLSAPG